MTTSGSRSWQAEELPESGLHELDYEPQPLLSGDPIMYMARHGMVERRDHPLGVVSFCVDVPRPKLTHPSPVQTEALPVSRFHLHLPWV